VSTLYKCCDCDKVFDSPLVERETDVAGIGPYDGYDVFLCPGCRSDNIDKGAVCSFDGCEEYADDEHSFCATHNGDIWMKLNDILSEYGTNERASSIVLDIMEAFVEVKS
jgi:hypothetical protein